MTYYECVTEAYELFLKAVYELLEEGTMRYLSILIAVILTMLFTMEHTSCVSPAPFASSNSIFLALAMRRSVSCEIMRHVQRCAAKQNHRHFNH